MIMANIKFEQNDQPLVPSPVYVENITDQNGTSLTDILDSINQVSAEYSEGTTIASINDIPIKIPDGDIPIVGTKIFTTLATLKASDYAFSVGEVLYTKGYRKANDGGASYYIVIEEIQNTQDDGVTYFELQNGLYAEIMVPANETFNLYQFGGQEFNENQAFDNGPIILKFVNYCKRVNHNYTLFIPGGVWTMTPTDIESTIGFRMTGESPTSGSVSSCSRLVGVVGDTVAYLLNLSGPYFDIRNLHFGTTSQPGGTGSSGGFLHLDEVAKANKSIILNGVTDSFFDGIYQTQGRTLFDISNSHNLYFGWLNIRQSGQLTRQTMRFGDDVYGVYFDYFNIETITGSAFYGYGTDLTKPCQFVINDLQMEGTSPTSGTDPGYDVDGSHYFVFDGHLGNRDYPCIVNNMSISNLGSYSGGYKCFSVVGHETNTDMGIIFGNYFLDSKDESNTWLLLDKSQTQNAFITVNQPLASSSRHFYLKDANCPIVNTIKQRDGIMPASYADAVKVSYRSGAYSPHSLVGSNDDTQPYTLFVFPNRRLGMRFYNAGGISSFIITVTVETSIGVFDNPVQYQIQCDSTAGWVNCYFPDFGYTYPRKVQIKGLPKNIDYFADYD